jgi:hypothetical protein
MPEPYTPLRGRVKAVTVVFAVVALVYALRVWADLLDLRLLSQIVAGTQVSDGQLNTNDTRLQLLGVFEILALLAAAIVFIGWLHAAYKNVDVVAPGERRFGHGWAIGSWFVPFFNLVRPKSIVNDVWRAGGKDPVDATPGGILLCWWGAWLLGNFILARVAGRYESEDTPEEIRTGAIIMVISDMFSIVGALLAIAVVRMTTDRLDAKAAALPSPPPAPGPDFTAPERPAGVPA